MILELEYETFYDYEARNKISMSTILNAIYKKNYSNMFPLFYSNIRIMILKCSYFFMKNCKSYCTDKIILKGIHKNLKLGMYAFLLRYINALHLTLKSHLSLA